MVGCQSETIKIGTLLDKTGDLGNYGPPMEVGADLAITLLTDAGVDIVKVPGDSGTANQKSIAEATRLIDIEGVSDYYEAVDWLMFDAKAPDSMDNALPGGNALKFDWNLLAGRNWSLPWMLAGGLNAENVGTAVAESGAMIVDVSSGVESSPGEKDPLEIERFMQAVLSL